jgi:hypothetical protein
MPLRAVKSGESRANVRAGLVGNFVGRNAACA